MTAPATIPAIAGSPSVSADTSRLETSKNLKAAGQKFEAVFIGMMLKSMRSASTEDGLLDSESMKQFRDMQDAKTAEAMAVHTPLGIGKAMTEFLSRSQPALQEEASAAKTSSE